ncbi:FxsA family protein [Gallaecimonas sp. GXIMD4217]|uniref:FxsA family protein n=1 Tax=Gallaecimonas sp. GXIMD4217 TaxID=3131927 RepID=UPI00311AFB7D
MLGRLFLLFLIVPFVEIALLIQLGEIIGGAATIALMIITAIVGATLVRRAGLETWQEAQRRMAMGEMPGQQLCEGLLLLIAGVVLVTPGLITDLLGLALLLPPVRKRLARQMGQHLVVHGAGSAPFGAGPQGPFEQGPFQAPEDKGGRTIEGDYERKD